MLKSRGEPVDNPRGDIYSSRPRQTTPSTPCPGGEIGRHASFRCWWPKGRGGSSPLLGTTFESLDSNIGAFLFAASISNGLVLSRSCTSCTPRHLCIHAHRSLLYVLYTATLVHPCTSSWAPHSEASIAISRLFYLRRRLAEIL